MPESSAAPEVALCLNAGSSSLKFALFEVSAGAEQALASGAVEGLGGAEARGHLKVGEQRAERTCAGDTASALSVAFELLKERGLPQPTVVGHRVVHGGAEHVRPALIDSALLASLNALVPLAPLHMPAALSGIHAVSRQFPELPQVACFDTAFHATMPELARRLPLPAHFYDAGLRRYGFHGLSYEYVLSTLGATPPARIIVAHLGNGSSLAAVLNGQCIDTSMSFTPGGGLMMGTRTGDLDPGVLLYLLREKGYTPDSLEHLLERESGLLGTAGTSDMKTLVKRAASDEQARLAISLFAYSVRKGIGAYIAALGGIDLLVFTGGIGEHTPSVRQEACQGLAALGIELDAARNRRNGGVIQTDASRCAVRVIATDEDRIVARHARAVLRA